LKIFILKNYDDAVAVKPCNEGGINCQCASSMTIRYGSVKWSVGLTIGSVPPNTNINCVYNITFHDINMLVPIKALYIKSNPGNKGTGRVEAIFYHNINIVSPLWYPIWIGPQQQDQPSGGADTGCSFLYPLNQTCATNPLVSINNVFLRNITITGGITLPGVLLCDPANPCHNITFTDVSIEGNWLVQNDWVCKNAEVNQYHATPVLVCTSTEEEEVEEEMNLNQTLPPPIGWAGSDVVVVGSVEEKSDLITLKIADS